MPAEETTAQFQVLCEHFGLTVKPEDLMSRCAKCNNRGYRHLTPDQARASKAGKAIPDKVLKAVSDFWQCRGCGKLYWWVRI